MICEQCKKNAATVHLTKIINNQKNTINLCEDCASNYHNFSLFNDGNFSIHKLLASLLGDPSSHENNLVSYHQLGQQCPQCQSDYAEFRKKGKLSCSNCYEEFKKYINPMVKRIHGSNQHQGKVPKRTGHSYKMKRDLDKLRSKLKALIEQEEFEEAAIVRDEIRQLEQQLNS